MRKMALVGVRVERVGTVLTEVREWVGLTRAI